MGRQYRIIISAPSFYREFELAGGQERAKIGTTSACDMRLDREMFFRDIEIELKKGEEWTLFTGEELYAGCGDARRLMIAKIHHGDALSICYADSGEQAFEFRFLIDFEAEKKQYGCKVDLKEVCPLTVGDAENADIRLLSEACKGSFITVAENDGKVSLTIKSAPLGAYVNGEKVSTKKDLADHDFISVADFSAYVSAGELFFDRNSVKLGKHILSAAKAGELEGPYPLFVRSTRSRSAIDTEPIKVLDPDTKPSKPEINLVLTLMPAIVMFVLVVVLRGIMNTSGGTYVLFSICSMGLGVVTSVLNIIYSKKRYKENCKKREEVYKEYVKNKTEEIRSARSVELASLRDTYYSTVDDVQHAGTFSSDLFDRIPTDDDFLDIYLGVGRRKAAKEIDYRERETLETGDDLSRQPGILAEKYEFLEDAPVIVRAREANAIGVVGSKADRYEFLKVIVTDLITRQFFDDVNLYAFVDGETEKYNWLRLIPHLNRDHAFRNIVSDTESKKNVFETLYKDLALRSEGGQITGFNVVLVMDENGIKNHPVSQFIGNASQLGTVFIFFEEDKSGLPLHCSQIIYLQEDRRAYIYPVTDRNDKTHFRYARVSDEAITRMAEIISPVYCEKISLENTLRKNLSLYELLHIYSAEDIDLGKRWAESRIYETMEAPLGVNAKDEIVTLNLHEKSHGPHGLVAGTTGSGKSELLQAYILSASTLFPPSELGFVIIDFKGGGMVNQFRTLPHLIGSITNIDGNEIQRSLKSIRAELLKRQNCFAEAGVNHIDKYIRLYKEGKAATPIPHLVIIVDEFAELKAEQPEFMKELISTARIGRSLGVHLILATQKPSGVVDAQIWSNSHFRLCLKVQTKEDSNEMIKTPLASEIREPGRAYLQVGNNEIFELFQSAYSGAPAAVDAENANKAFTISEVDFNGKRKPVYIRTKKKNTSHVRNQLEAIVEYIGSYCRTQGIEKLPDICLPSLPVSMYFDGCERRDGRNIYAAFGLMDDPDHQLQTEYLLDLTSANHIIIGSGQMGKTNILQLIIRSLAENYSPEEVNIYVCDFASMILKNFEGLSHVGGVVTASEDDKLKNLFRLLAKEVSARKVKLAEAGVSSFISYKEAGHTDLPLIVVIIDNLTGLKELYLQEEDFLLPLLRDGNAVGISFVAANGQTAGIGYRYLSSFESRSALFCSESSEYTMLFEGCRMKLPPVPGRTLIEVEKNIYECQTYLAFEGEKEFERVANIRKFVERQKEKAFAHKAKRIPQIPDVLDQAYVEENFPELNADGRMVTGMDYEQVEPLTIRLEENDMIVLSGKKEESRHAFARYLVDTLRNGSVGSAVFYVMDGIGGFWKDMEDMPETESYSTLSDSAVDMITEISQVALSRYEKVAQEGISSLESEPWIVAVMEDREAIQSISGSKEASSLAKDIFRKYSGMKILFIFTDIPDASICLSAPDLMKLIKERKRYYIFDDIGSIKLVDVSLSTGRKYAKPLEKGDAYYVDEGEIRKIRTIGKE